VQERHLSAGVHRYRASEKRQPVDDKSQVKAFSALYASFLAGNCSLQTASIPARTSLPKVALWSPKSLRLPRRRKLALGGPGAAPRAPLPISQCHGSQRLVTHPVHKKSKQRKIRLSDRKDISRAIIGTCSGSRFATQGSTLPVYSSKHGKSKSAAEARNRSRAVHQSFLCNNKTK